MLIFQNVFVCWSSGLVCILLRSIYYYIYIILLPRVFFHIIFLYKLNVIIHLRWYLWHYNIIICILFPYLLYNNIYICRYLSKNYNVMPIRSCTTVYNNITWYIIIIWTRIFDGHISYSSHSSYKLRGLYRYDIALEQQLRYNIILCAFFGRRACNRLTKL